MDAAHLGALVGGVSETGGVPAQLRPPAVEAVSPAACGPVPTDVVKRMKTKPPRHVGRKPPQSRSAELLPPPPPPTGACARSPRTSSRWATPPRRPRGSDDDVMMVYCCLCKRTPLLSHSFTHIVSELNTSGSGLDRRPQSGHSTWCWWAVCVPESECSQPRSQLPLRFPRAPGATSVPLHARRRHLRLQFGRPVPSEAEVPNMSVRLAWSGWTAVRGDSAAEPHLGLERAPVARPRPHALVLEHPAGREAEERRR
jgi:hypothetical protein